MKKKYKGGSAYLMQKERRKRMMNIERTEEKKLYARWRSYDARRRREVLFYSIRKKMGGGGGGFAWGKE